MKMSIKLLTVGMLVTSAWLEVYASNRELVASESSESLLSDDGLKSSVSRNLAQPKEASDKADDCLICLEPMMSEQSIKKLPCEHCFHDGCIAQWLTNNNTCPTCRGPTKHPALIQAVLHQDSKHDIMAMIDGGADVNEGGIGGMTALMAAAAGGWEAMVDLLITKGAIIEAKDRRGRTALMIAAHDGCAHVVQVLMDKGARVEAIDNAGMTALMIAAIAGRSGVVTTLLGRGAAANTKSSSGKTALMLAVQAGRIGVVRQLLGHGADVTIRDNAGRTALDYAGAHERIRYILLHPDEKPSLAVRVWERLTDR